MTSADRREKNAAWQRTYRAKNVEKYRASYRRWNMDNKDKINARAKLYRKRYRDKIAASKRRRKFGTDGRALWESQRGLCAICKVDLMTLTPKHRHLDHDHITKKVRGWLCYNCNHMIGKAKDDPARLQAAIKYLEASK